MSSRKLIQSFISLALIVSAAVSAPLAQDKGTSSLPRSQQVTVISQSITVSTRATPATTALTTDQIGTVQAPRAEEAATAESSTLAEKVAVATVALGGSSSLSTTRTQSSGSDEKADSATNSGASSRANNNQSGFFAVSHPGLDAISGRLAANEGDVQSRGTIRAGATTSSAISRATRSESNLDQSEDRAAETTTSSTTTPTKSTSSNSDSQGPAAGQERDRKSQRTISSTADETGPEPVASSSSTRTSEQMAEPGPVVADADHMTGQQLDQLYDEDVVPDSAPMALANESAFYGLFADDSPTREEDYAGGGQLLEDFDRGAEAPLPAGH